MFSPNTMILLSNTAALSADLAEGSGAVGLQLPPASSTSVLDSSSLLASLYPPVTRRTYMTIIHYIY